MNLLVRLRTDEIATKGGWRKLPVSGRRRAGHNLEGRDNRSQSEKGGTTSHKRRKRQENKKNQNFTNCSWFISTCWHVPSWLRVWIRPSQRVWLQDSRDRGVLQICCDCVSCPFLGSSVGIFHLFSPQQCVPPKGRGWLQERDRIRGDSLAAKNESDSSTTHYYNSNTPENNSNHLRDWLQSVFISLKILELGDLLLERDPSLGRGKIT